MAIEEYQLLFPMFYFLFSVFLVCSVSVTRGGRTHTHEPPDLGDTLIRVSQCISETCTVEEMHILVSFGKSLIKLSSV